MGTRADLAFERDRLKWARLQANGIDVMPLAVRSAQRDPQGTIRALLQTLAHKDR